MSKLYSDYPLSLIETPKHKTGETDDFTQVGSVMAIIHNVWIRGFNSIYQQAPQIPPADYKDFINYSLVWWDCLEHHHTGEEERYFPKIEALTGVKGIMDGEVAEHEAFSAGLEEFHTYLLQCQKSPAAFSAEKLIAIMDSFGPVLHEHLSHEPPNLVALRKYDFDIATMNNQHGEEEMKSTHPVHRLPFLWVNWDDDFEDGMWKDFIQMPVIVRFIFSRVLSLWHRRMWRFGSCTYTGQRKELLYGKPVEEMKVQ